MSAIHDEAVSESSQDLTVTGSKTTGQGGMSVCAYRTLYSTGFGRLFRGGSGSAPATARWGSASGLVARSCVCVSGSGWL